MQYIKGGVIVGYTALYRKFRPTKFSEMVGQEHIKKTLINQLIANRVGHAYLFNGGRGTGKTTTAKILARAVNCLNLQDGEPCNECEICKGALDGSLTDIVEMDAASNNSVENIRQIRQEVVYATVDVKYRVYIIDEVHMLTTSAFNALLKTLEEPPENVVFILATTEQHKIPVTILSRCLKFDFNRLSEEDLYNRVKYVLEQEGVKYEDEACKYIATLADGAARDALSILDRCISETEDTLKYEDVQNIVGAIDKKLIEKVVDDILEYNSLDALAQVDEVVKKGKDLRQFTFELTTEFLKRLIDAKENTDRFVGIIDRLSSLDNDLKSTTRKEIVLKACIVQLCNPQKQIVSQGETTVQVANAPMDAAYAKKIEQLEREVRELKEKVASGVTVQQAPQTPKVNVAKELKEKVEVEGLTEFPSTEELKREMIERGKVKVYSALAKAKIYIDDVVRIITTNSFGYKILTQDDSAQAISQVLFEKYKVNKNMVLELITETGESVSKIEKILKDNNIEYTNLD